VSVLIADFANRTNDPVFDGLLEQAMAFGVETASFVSAYPRHDAQRLAGQLKQGGTLDEPTATLVALREGVNRVVAGSIALDGGEYQLGLRLLNPNAQDEKARVLMAWDTKAANRDAVLGAVGRMAARVREALGDATAQSDAVTDEESFTAASLEAARAYSTAQELQWAGKYDAPTSSTSAPLRWTRTWAGRSRGWGPRRAALAAATRPRPTTNRRWRNSAG